MADYNSALTRLLAIEGGYVNNPNDNGGETYKGISRNNFPNWKGWEHVDKAPKGPGINQYLSGIKALQEAVAEFYKFNFWDKLKADNIVSQQVANMLFDYSVNFGIAGGVTVFQKACNVLGEGVTEDGIMGPGTVNAINGQNGKDLVQVVKAVSAERYLNIVRKNKSQKVFLKGWLNRAGIDW